MKINAIKVKERRETQKYFKCEKKSHIKRYYRIKQKQITFTIFNASKNEKVLETKKN